MGGPILRTTVQSMLPCTIHYFATLVPRQPTVALGKLPVSIMCKPLGQRATELRDKMRRKQRQMWVQHVAPHVEAPLDQLSKGSYIMLPRVFDASWVPEFVELVGRQAPAAWGKFTQRCRSGYMQTRNA
jgi:hypothetical protein